MRADVQPLEVPKVADRVDAEAIARRVEEARKRKKWTKADLERKSGVPSSTLSRWATGDYQPSVIALAKVALAMNVSLDQLIGAVEIPQPGPDEPAGDLSKPESDLVMLYRENEHFRRIVNNVIAELRLRVEEE